MSRSGYSYDYEYMDLYRNSVERAISGKRGQAFLRELATQMDAMPEKKLIAGDLVSPAGECCTIGVICKARGLSTKGVDVEDRDSVAALVGISPSMAAEIEYENDEADRGLPGPETDEQRWTRMRKWVADNLK